MEQINMEFKQLPAVAPSYLKVFLAKKPGLKEGETIPHIQASIKNYRPCKHKVNQYRKLCQFDNTGFLPITFPHILASTLHMQVLTASQFPLKLLGLVHIRNKITQYRAIEETEAVDISCHVSGARTTDKGIEFDLVTELSQEGSTLWESTSTMLSRQKGTGNKHKKKDHDGQSGWNADHHSRWTLPHSLGRQYASISGDYNPIHLSDISARLFGFHKAIAHGMWTLARVGAQLGQYIIPDKKTTLEVQFKLPILLPANVIFAYGEADNTIQYKVLNSDAEKPHLEGCLISI